MISNITPYYRQCFNANEKFYIEVRNSCPDYLYIYLNYTIGTKKIAKPSAPFAPGKVGRVTFPDNATKIIFVIFDCFCNPPAVVCRHSIPDMTIAIYEVTGPRHGRLKCTKITC